MKNIHLIPTEKPSRLYLVKSNNKLDITSNNPEYTENFGSGTQNQHIYITSDEEIKDGDWCYQVELNDGKVDKCYDVTLYHTWTNNGVDKTRKFKKIILTSDQDLIKDGVQAIDDEFLEWFVKNPSCEEVEVERDSREVGGHNGGVQIEYGLYEILIPKEEQKQHLIDMMRYDEELGLYEKLKQDWFCPKCDSYVSSESVTFEETHQTCNTGVVIKEPKQEATLEEAGGIAAGLCQHLEEKEQAMFIAGFIECAKWEAKRRYSEEEVLNLLDFINDRLPDLYSRFSSEEELKEWFEQFKKK